MSCAPANRLPPRLGRACSHGGAGPGRGYCFPSLTRAIRGAIWRSPGRQLRGHQDPFRPHRLNARCPLSEGTLAGTHGNGRDARQGSDRFRLGMCPVRRKVAVCRPSAVGDLTGHMAAQPTVELESRIKAFNAVERISPHRPPRPDRTAPNRRGVRALAPRRRSLPARPRL